MKTHTLRLPALAATIALAVAGTACAQEWKPDKPIELIATNAPGGGSDRILRIMVKILGGYIPTPANVVNRPGGGELRRLQLREPVSR